MFERFTNRAIKSIFLAQEEGKRLGHNFVGSEQILLGLLGEGTGIAAKAIKSMGVNLKDARVEVEKIIGRGSGFFPVEIPFTPRAKRILEFSWDAARELDHNYVSTEHLLLGIIRQGDGSAVRVLGNLGVDLQKLRQAVIEEMKFEELKSVGTAKVVAESEAPAAQQSQPLIGPDLLVQPRDPFYDRFTERAVRSIVLAHEEARRLGHNFVGTDVMLLGLIGEGHGAAAKALKGIGVSLKDARVEVEKIIGRGSGFVVSVEFTPRARRVLELARSQASERGHHDIGTGHVLLGIIRSGGEGVAVRSLENLGVDLQKLCEAVIKEVETENDT